MSEPLPWVISAHVGWSYQGPVLCTAFWCHDGDPLQSAALLRASEVNILHFAVSLSVAVFPLFYTVKIPTAQVSGMEAECPTGRLVTAQCFALLLAWQIGKSFATAAREWLWQQRVPDRSRGTYHVGQQAPATPCSLAGCGGVPGT